MDPTSSNPSPPQESTPVARVYLTPQQQVPDGVRAVASFLDFEPLGLALLKSGFTITEEAQCLINIFRNAKAPKDRVAASRQLHAIIDQQAKANNLYGLQNTTTLSQSKGTLVRSERSTTRLLELLSQVNNAQTQDFLEGHVVYEPRPDASPNGGEPEADGGEDAGGSHLLPSSVGFADRIQDELGRSCDGDISDYGAGPSD